MRGDINNPETLSNPVAPTSTPAGARHPAGVYMPKAHDIDKLLEIILGEMNDAQRLQREAVDAIRNATNNPGSARDQLELAHRRALIATVHLERAGAWLKWTIDPSRIPDTDV